MQDLGARVISVEINEAEFGNTKIRIKNPVVGDGRQLPFESESFDAILCSNVLEHTPESEVLLSELTRCLKTNGWAYVSWTNWLSPWGGHAVAPLHYLGPKRSLAVWTRLFGKPKGKNIPLAGVWPYSIKQIIREVRTKPNVEILRIFPRYWPRWKFIVRIPLLREFFTWNCVITFRKF
jgi:SAM-dependent methyltransferase